jgi:hypothetical protein
MRSITMTNDETARYDADDRDLMTSLIGRATVVAEQTGETVEIRTEDGIVAGVVYASRGEP